MSAPMLSQKAHIVIDVKELENVVSKHLDHDGTPAYCTRGNYELTSTELLLILLERQQSEIKELRAMIEAMQANK